MNGLSDRGSIPLSSIYEGIVDIDFGIIFININFLIKVSIAARSCSRLFLCKLLKYSFILPLLCITAELSYLLAYLIIHKIDGQLYVDS